MPKESAQPARHRSRSLPLDRSDLSLEQDPIGVSKLQSFIDRVVGDENSHLDPAVAQDLDLAGLEDEMGAVEVDGPLSTFGGAAFGPVVDTVSLTALAGEVEPYGVELIWIGWPGIICPTSGCTACMSWERASNSASGSLSGLGGPSLGGDICGAGPWERPSSSRFVAFSSTGKLWSIRDDGPALVDSF
jgi:hypothetical protein